MSRAALTIVALCALSGCVADVNLRHTTSGRLVVCEGGHCPGVLCLPAQQRQFRCIDDYQRQGYERSSD